LGVIVIRPWQTSQVSTERRLAAQTSRWSQAGIIPIIRQNRL
jgi:hypothetical protein